MTTTGTTYRQRMLLKKWAIDRAGGRCEGSPTYPNCRAKDGQAHPVTDKPVTLRTIRTDPGNEESVRVMCERCLLSWDFKSHQTADWRADRQAAGNLELFPIESK